MYRYIKAMSQDRKVIQLKLDNASEKINEHIIKLLLYPESENYNHWKQEIFSFLHFLPSLKGSNKRPKYEFILSGLLVYNDMLSSFKKDVIEDESLLSPRNVSVATIDKVITDYYKWVALEFSQKDSLSRSDVYAKLDELTERA